MRTLWKKNRIGFFLAVVPIIFFASLLTAALTQSPFVFVPAALCCLIYPFLLTAINLYYLFLKKPNLLQKKTAFVSSVITIPTGVILTGIYSMFQNITDSDWNVRLVNGQVHTPIANAHTLTFCIFVTAGIVGFSVLSLWHTAATRPPLVTVLCISMTYIGCIACILYMIQVFDQEKLFMLLPFNGLILTARIVRQSLSEWNAGQKTKYIPVKPSCRSLNGLLMRSECWPALAFVLMFPLLGILICILLLFGQAPDSIIKAFTETSEWKLSQQTSLPNTAFDEHYLCTVAAGGHKKLVKPIRMGKRHDHIVTVNRQLCIANAFEQILEERAPRFHKVIRSFYDNYGYPIARHIHSPFAADIIYLLMKPAEWLFLGVIYLCDTKPENRIASQYLGSALPPNGSKVLS